MFASGQADRAARLVVAVLLCAIVFWLNYRFVLAHFARGSELLDTGWFLWIFTSGDPWLINPRAISDLSYFNYHLTPYVSAISVLLHATGLDRFTAFALHQGAIFALYAAGLFALVLPRWQGGRSPLLFTAAALLAVCGDVVLQVATLPHYEIVIVAFCLFGAALWQSAHRGWGALAFALACLTREDGGLYAAALLFALALLPPLSRQTLRSSETLSGVACVLVALLMFAIKYVCFPGFSAFAFNYSGNHWDHLTADSIVMRLGNFVADPHAMTAIACAAVLGLASWRYLIQLVFMAPIIGAQLLAARIPLWTFRYYYVLPFLVIWAGIFIVATSRARAGTLRAVEPAVILAFAIVASAPFLFVAAPKSMLPVAALALVGETTDLPAFADALRDAIVPTPGACASIGVGGIIPNDLAPDQVVERGFNLDHCRSLFVFRRDGDYATFTWRLAFWHKGETIGGRVIRYDHRP